MSRRRGARSRGQGFVPVSRTGQTMRKLPASAYRDYPKRCEFSGVEPVEFTEFIRRARRWRNEYGPAKDRGDFSLTQELEALLCI